MTQRKRHIATEELAALLEGELPASQASELTARLRDDGEARRSLAVLERVRDTLGADAPELAGLDLTKRVHDALGAAPVEPAQPTPWLAWCGGFAALAAAVLLLWVGARPPETFREKAARPGASDAQRWSAIRLHHEQNGELVELRGSLGRSEGLLVSYANLGPRPFTHLMVFAVDASGEVRWFYPSYERSGQNPGSIAIAAGANTSLGEFVEHDYAPGAMTVYALFTRTPLHVADIERLARTHRGVLSEQLFDDAALKTVHVRVAP